MIGDASAGGHAAGELNRFRFIHDGSSFSRGFRHRYGAGLNWLRGREPLGYRPVELVHGAGERGSEVDAVVMSQNQD
jgi:hypothetical protein